MKRNMINYKLVISLTFAAISSYAWSPKYTNEDSLRKSRPTMRMISKQQLGTFEKLETAHLPSERKVALLDYTSEMGSSLSSSSMLVDFNTAWGFQRQILDDQIERLSIAHKSSKEGDDHDFASSFLPKIEEVDKTNDFGHRDTIIMLQHRPVFTLGTGSDDKFIKSSHDNHADNGSVDNSYSSVPIIRMDRGGEVTYHGPGQITVYPVLDLRNYRQDIHWYMRALEEAIILAISKCASGANSLRAEREDDVTGVWIDNHKVAAVGIKCRRWITQHGLAVNVEESSLSNFQGIVPCGLEGRKVGCLNQFLVEKGREPITVRDFSILMKEALEDVFRIELVNQPLLF